ncbi:MAG: energy-coupling factor ABC transporter permease [Spirochaetes bacterium]|nr:energy-coupling factor ABC transporter permease [Spirochaetota bacterium]MCK5268753.1 energy-coupling factor ABC transporter permease [Spirochaetota bacterium]
MHIPDGFLNLPVILTGNGLALGFLYTAVKKTAKMLPPERIPVMGLLAAFIFMVQIISFPVPGGTSVHLLGGALVVILLGPWTGLLLVTASLFLQAVLFQHGGILTIGINIINNAAAACLTANIIFNLFSKKRLLTAAGLASFFSVIAAAAFCIAVLSVGMVIPLKLAVIPVAAGYILAAGLEAFVTVMIIITIKRIRPDLLKLNRI